MHTKQDISPALSIAQSYMDFTPSRQGSRCALEEVIQQLTAYAHSAYSIGVETFCKKKSAVVQVKYLQNKNLSSIYKLTTKNKSVSPIVSIVRISSPMRKIELNVIKQYC